MLLWIEAGGHVYKELVRLAGNARDDNSIDIKIVEAYLTRSAKLREC